MRDTEVCLRLTALIRFVNNYFQIFGMAREHRTPLVGTRCLARDQYQKLKRRYEGKGLAPEKLARPGHYDFAIVSANYTTSARNIDYLK
jgi:hypothetical protein